MKRRVLLAALAAAFGTSIFTAVRATRAATMYVSSFGQSTVVQIGPTGAVTTFATLPANAAPKGLAFDGGGNLLVGVERPVVQVDKIPSNGAVGVLATVSDSIGIGGVAFDASGNLFVGELSQEQVGEITPSGVVSVFATLPGIPTGLAFDRGGNLFVAVISTKQILEITPGGAISTFANLTDSPEGLAFDQSGNLYEAGGSSSLITRFTPAGSASLFATLPQNSDPIGLAFDNNGSLFVADLMLSNIRKISPDGHTVTIFASGINEPEYIAFAPAPEPASLFLLGFGASALVMRRRCRNERLQG